MPYFDDDGGLDGKRLALFLRYQTTHERAFHKCLNDLLKLRAEKRKQEIGFEWQKQKKDLNEARVRLTNARASHIETTESQRPSFRPEPANDLTGDGSAKQAA